MTPKELGESVSESYKEHGDKWAYLVAPLYEARGKLIKASAERGTMVHFVDSQHPDLATKIRTFDHFNAERDTLTKKLDKAYVERYGLAKALRNEFQEYAGEVLRLEPLAESARREKVAEVSNILRTNPEAMQAYTSGIQSRLAYDSKLASSIMEITEGRKTVVMYGLTHGSGMNDLDEQLGPNTARIILVENEEIFQIQTQRDYSMGNEQPEGYLNTSNGSFVSGEAAYKIAEKYDPNRSDAEPKEVQEPALDDNETGLKNFPQP